jgi:hypothetical protein
MINCTKSRALVRACMQISMCPCIQICCKTKTVNSTVPDTLCPCIQISPDSRLLSKGRREKRAQGKATGPRGMHATQQGRNRQNLSSPSVQVCVRAYARPWPCTSPSSNNTSRHDTGHAHVQQRTCTCRACSILCIVGRWVRAYVLHACVQCMVRCWPGSSPARTCARPVHACSAPCARGACSLARVSGRARTDADRRDRGVTCASRRGAREGRTASWPG